MRDNFPRTTTPATTYSISVSGKYPARGGTYEMRAFFFLPWCLFFFSGEEGGSCRLGQSRRAWPGLCACDCRVVLSCVFFVCVFVENARGQTVVAEYDHVYVLFPYFFSLNPLMTIRGIASFVCITLTMVSYVCTVYSRRVVSYLFRPVAFFVVVFCFVCR